MNITQLNLDCLEAILCRTPFHQQFHLLGVCTTWRLVLERLLSTRHSLTLIDSKMNFRHYIDRCFPNYCTEDRALLALKPIGSGRDDDVRFKDDHLGPGMAEVLGRLLPNVRRLVIHLAFDEASWRRISVR